MHSIMLDYLHEGQFLRHIELGTLCVGNGAVHSGWGLPTPIKLISVHSQTCPKFVSWEIPDPVSHHSHHNCDFVAL